MHMPLPGDYEAWYHTPRGAWIARREFDLMWHLLPMPPGATLLDVGCGTGHFARRYAAAGLRVARRGVVLGLLHRRSQLYRHKAGRGSYSGARWDDAAAVRAWTAVLDPAPAAVNSGYAIFLPGGGTLARLTEGLAPRWLPWGGFLAVGLAKRET